MLPDSQEPVSILVGFWIDLAYKSLSIQTSWYARMFLLNSGLEIKIIYHMEVERVSLRSHDQPKWWEGRCPDSVEESMGRE